MGKDLKGNPLPPGIMQRKSGIYRGRFYYKGETYTKDNADLKKLVQEMEDLRYEVKHGLKGKGDNITLDTWFDIWLNTHKKRTIKESTQVRYDDFYRRYIKKQIGKQRVADFNPIILERLLQNMADDDYSTKTIRDVYNILNAMFKYAVHNRIPYIQPMCRSGSSQNKDKTDTGTDCERTTGSIGTRKGENTRESHTGSTRNGNAWRRTAWAYMG